MRRKFWEFMSQFNFEWYADRDGGFVSFRTLGTVSGTSVVHGDLILVTVPPSETVRTPSNFSGWNTEGCANGIGNVNIASSGGFMNYSVDYCTYQAVGGMYEVIFRVRR